MNVYNFENGLFSIKSSGFLLQKDKLELSVINFWRNENIFHIIDQIIKGIKVPL